MIVLGVIGPSEVGLLKTINALFGSPMGIADSQPLEGLSIAREYKIQDQSIPVGIFP